MDEPRARAVPDRLPDTTRLCTHRPKLFLRFDQGREVGSVVPDAGRVVLIHDLERPSGFIILCHGTRHGQKPTKTASILHGFLAPPSL